MIIELKINFSKIRDRINAAELLYTSGKEVDSKNVLVDVAKDINEHIKDK